MKRFICIALPILLCSCAATVARYSEISYQQGTRCKAEALRLVEKATTPYSENIVEIETVQLDLLAAYEFDAGRDKNGYTILIWDTILNERGHTFAGFIQLWKRNGTLRPAFVRDQRSIISRVFNQLTDAEQGKLHE